MEDRRWSLVVTRMDFLQLKTSLEQKIEDIVETMKKALEAMSERIDICEERCKEPVNPSKRRHEDPERGPQEGSKRQRLTNLLGFRQGRSIRTMPLSDRPDQKDLLGVVVIGDILEKRIVPYSWLVVRNLVNKKCYR